MLSSSKKAKKSPMIQEMDDNLYVYALRLLSSTTEAPAPSTEH
jgi:hypothetical protein